VISIGDAIQVGQDAVDAFSKTHPHIRMNRDEWADLIECIEQEVVALAKEVDGQWIGP
jgi:hypothetical protein